MLGFFVFMREVIRISRPLTNGGTGLTLPPSINRPMWYYVELALVLVLLALSWWLRRSRFGASLIAIREDETGAEMRGIDTDRNKVLIFTFSGFATGVFGGMWAYQNTFVDPDIAFFETRTIDAVMATMLGGLGTVAGPVLGSVVLYWLREVLWANFLDFHLLVQGVLLGLIVLYLPKGVIGLFAPASVGSTWIHRALGREVVETSTFDGMTSLLDEFDDDETSTELESEAGR
jgi:branched-chain amino acid transport system permease protein